MEGESGAYSQESPCGGDKGSAVVDCSSSFVAKEIGRHVADAESAGSFDDESFADFEFAEGEVAGAGVEDDVDPGEGHIATGPLRDPGIFTDFQPDGNVSALEGQITDGVLLAADFDVIRDAEGPGLEPAGFIVEAFAGEETFGDETEDFAISGEARGIEQAALMKKGHTHDDDHVARFGNDFVKDFKGGPLQSGGVEGVFASVAGDGHFGETEDARPLLPGFGDGGEDVCLIVVPIERCLVQYGRGNANSSHDEFLRATSTRSSFF